MTRLAGRLRDTLRTAWRPAAWAIGAGLLLEVLFPVGAPWLPAVAAGAFVVLSLLGFALGAWAEHRHPPEGLAEADERRLGRAALLERWSTPAQFGYAFGAASLVLLALAIGFGVGHLAGFGS